MNFLYFISQYASKETDDTETTLYIYTLANQSADTEVQIFPLSRKKAAHQSTNNPFQRRNSRHRECKIWKVLHVHTMKTYDGVEL